MGQSKRNLTKIMLPFNLHVLWLYYCLSWESLRVIAWGDGVFVCHRATVAAGRRLRVCEPTCGSRTHTHTMLLLNCSILGGELKLLLAKAK